MLVTREEYYQDVSRHRRDIAVLSAELNARNERGSVYAGAQYVTCLEKQAPVCIEPKPSKVFGYVDIY